MYLKEKNVRLLRIKNIIFTFIGVFSVFVCGFLLSQSLHITEIILIWHGMQNPWQVLSPGSL